MMGRPDLCKTSLCQRWAKGTCPLEAGECRFAHGRLDLRATPNFMHGTSNQAGDGSEQADFGNLETEAAQIAQQQLYGPPSSGLSQPSPWQEESWAARNQKNQGNLGNEALLDQMQAVLAQREWQWSPEYGDSLQDGDSRQAARRPRRPRGAKASSQPLPQEHRGMPAQLQQLFNSGAQQGPEFFQNLQHRENLMQLQQQQSPQQQQWAPAAANGNAMLSGDGWVQDASAHSAYAVAQEQAPYGMDSKFSEFPHAITAPDANIMHSTVPQELKAIWG